MKVNTTHPLYDEAFARWRLVRDCIEGQEAIKRQGTRYLPATFADDDEQRYNQYLGRAYFMNVTGRTHAALLGMVFRKAPVYDVPAQIESILSNVDGTGLSLTQLAKAAVSDQLSVGRFGILVDHPSVEGGLDAEQERVLGLRPIIASYPAEAIINWRWEGLNGRKTLTLLVLAEELSDRQGDEFSHDTKTVYRVLRLREGVYTQTLYDETGRAMSEEMEPRMAGGAAFDRIPFHFVGAQNNYPHPDIAPLLDMAHLNVAHYQSTAELKENQFFSAQGTLHLDTGEMDSDTFNALNPHGVSVGRRIGIVTSGGGSASLLQGDSRQADILATMDHEERQMVAIGARLVQRGGQAETAEAARINASAESSTLDCLVGNASEAIENALKDASLFMGVNPELVSYELNTEFWEAGLSPQALQAIQGGVGKLYGAMDAIEMIRAGRIYLRDDRDNEQILEDAASTLLDGQDFDPSTELTAN